MMGSNKNDFYVGYFDKMPTSNKKTIVAFLSVIFLLAFTLLGIILTNQEYFPNSTFELGQLTQVEGVLVMEPEPMLKNVVGRDRDGALVTQSILLIGFGKHRASQAIRQAEKKLQQDLEGKRVILEGTLIYFDGKTLLELTKQTDAIVEVKEAVEWKGATSYLGAKTLTGEIADPKCFFGVMKPGEGKAHRSCAALCIKGGIPPVLKVNSKEGNEYLILRGPNGEAINDQVLDKVGQAVTLTGAVEKIDDWLYMKVNAKSDIQSIGHRIILEAPMCKENLLSFKTN